jgi:hypothetical protein
VQVFFAQFGLMFPGISQPHIRDVILPAAYASGSTLDTDAHKLGLLFAILSIASLTRIPVSERLAVTTYYAQLSLAALGAVPIFERFSLDTVQATYLRSYFEFMLQNGTEELGRAYLSFACRLCYTVSILLYFPHKIIPHHRFQLGLRALMNTGLEQN